MNMSSHVFYPFAYWIVSLLLSFESSRYILDTSHLFYNSLQIFSSTCSFLFSIHSGLLCCLRFSLHLFLSGRMSDSVWALPQLPLPFAITWKYFRYTWIITKLMLFLSATSYKLSMPSVLKNIIWYILFGFLLISARKINAISLLLQVSEK